jgi:hypothetical protein
MCIGAPSTRWVDNHADRAGYFCAVGADIEALGKSADDAGEYQLGTRLSTAKSGARSSSRIWFGWSVLPAGLDLGDDLIGDLAPDGRAGILVPGFGPSLGPRGPKAALAPAMCVASVRGNAPLDHRGR